jgi:hypothetical protein
MTLQKRRKKGGGRKKVKRDGALKDSPVGISVWGTGIKAAEALLRHRQANLERALQKGYPAAAVGRYRREVRAARLWVEKEDAKLLQKEDRT